MKSAINTTSSLWRNCTCVCMEEEGGGGGGGVELSVNNILEGGAERQGVRGEAVR